jgi:hypothetical protein
LTVFRWFKKAPKVLDEYELQRREWTADQMLLDTDEAFANSVGVFRRVVTPPANAETQRLLDALLGGQLQQQADYAQRFGPMLGNMPAAQQQAMGARNPYLGVLGSLGNPLGIFGKF